MPKKEIFDKIGGLEKLNAIMDFWNYLVMQDSRVNVFFKKVNVANTKRKKKLYMAYHMGGALKYGGRDMAVAHLNLKLQDKHFNICKGYFEQSLNAYKVDETVKPHMMEMFESFRSGCLEGVGPLKG